VVPPWWLPVKQGLFLPELPLNFAQSVNKHGSSPHLAPADKETPCLDIGRSARYNARLAPVPFCVWLVTKLIRHQREVKGSHFTSRGPARVPRPDSLGRLPHDIARPVWVNLDDGAGLALWRREHARVR